MNLELKRLFEEDQNDLRTLHEHRKERDQIRRQRVQKMHADGEMREAIDFFHAALIFQHGETLTDWYTAHNWAREAALLGYEDARWLAAVSLDRWLVHQGRPAKYGNQLISFGPVYRFPLVEASTTDEERMEWKIPPFYSLLAWEKVSGFPPIRQRIIGPQIAGTQIDVVILDRPLAHSPLLPGIPCGVDSDNRSILENAYGWKWQERAGEISACWLSLPKSPIYSHIVAHVNGIRVYPSTYQNLPVVCVESNGFLTIYLIVKDNLWSITSRNLSDIHGIIQGCLYE
ncbi:hypothetical protein [Brevibacillus sp. 179-C 1.1 NHS]|uniref:hypothetical protein n=1 Tax=Brevibacillus sp. 179-C 1.1 NHS TaxID=3235177 RepID=UPI00399FD579